MLQSALSTPLQTPLKHSSLRASTLPRPPPPRARRPIATLLPTHVAAASASAITAEDAVSTILSSIEGSDSGDNLTVAQKAEIDGLLQMLESYGDAKTPRPLDDPLIFGNYEVAYVSSGQSQYGQPAGGRFRSGFGKLLFRTTLLAQSILQPAVVTNKVEFRLLGVLPGSVGLRGQFSILEDEGRERRDTVKVLFEPPVLSLPLGIHVRIGPPSDVVLKTQFVDARVRLGKGSRGSLFVFKRGGAASAAGMAEVGLQQCSTFGKVVLFGIVAALMGNGSWLMLNAASPPVIRAAGVVQVLFGTALGGILYRGGVAGEVAD